MSAQRIRAVVPSLSASRWAALVAGTGVAVYVVVKGYRFQRQVKERHKTKEFERWSQLAVFATGFTSALGVVYVAQLVRRYYHPSPERAFQSVLPILRANEEVRKAVGTQLRPGLFRAYSYAGGLGWRRWKLQNEPRSLQLMFQMDGEHSSAMVSLAVRRATLWGRRLQFTSLAVDLPSGERLLLKGPSSSVVFQGYTKLR